MRWIPQQSTILEINVPLNEALVMIGDWAKDPFPLLGGTVDCAFPGCSIKKDVVYTLLTKRWCDEFENKCSALPTALFITIKDVIVRQMEDQLPDGKLWNPSPQLMQQAQSCMPHNLGGECRFGFADSYMTRAPRASVLKMAGE